PRRYSSAIPFCGLLERAAREGKSLLVRRDRLKPTTMPHRGDSKIKIVSEEQAHALAAAAIDYELEKDRDRPAVRLAERVSAILKADFVILSGGDCSWSVLGAGHAQQPFVSAGALAL